MSRATSDDQLKFLLSCVKHSNNGKIDFVEVANECGIVSKGAAAKRYERLMKANGIHPNGGPAEKPPPKTPAKPRKRSRSPIVRTAAEKRQKSEGHLSNSGRDGKENMKPIVPKLESAECQPIQQEQPTIMSQFPRTYSQIPMSLPLAPTPVMQPAMAPYLFPGYSMAAQPVQEHQPYGFDDHMMFQHFCTPEMFSHTNAGPSFDPSTPRSLPLPPPPQEVVTSNAVPQGIYPTVSSTGQAHECILIPD